MNKIVYVVHSVDTEGPLYESIEAKFDRIKSLFNIDVEISHENLQQLKNGEIDLGGTEKDVQRILNGHLANYNETWTEIDEMLQKIMSDDFRKKSVDSFDGGWIFNWHCLDHIGYEYNPRRRDIGYHNIFDHYQEKLRLISSDDEIHWHFHPMSFYRDAHRCATSYENSIELHQILCRKIIERGWFPVVYRAGFQSERPDSNLFLEQWIPFDLSNMAQDDNSDLEQTVDFRNGRSADWRLAPSDWSVYHPHHDNYQKEGSCRRWIARSLNVLNRIASIDQREVDKAFDRANQGKSTLLGISGHDWRNLVTEVDHVRDLIVDSSSKYPEVKYKFSGALEAFRNVVYDGQETMDSLQLSAVFQEATEEDVEWIEVTATKGEVFGPQPYLAIQTKSRRFMHDNFDFDISPGRWFFAFHSDSIPFNDIEKVGIAANDKYGNQSIINLVRKGDHLVAADTMKNK